MKTFFFVGKNKGNVSGISYKIWKINQSGRMVEVQWGPAKWDKKRRKVVPAKPAANDCLETKPPPPSAKEGRNDALGPNVHA
jgi:hypothetical protein